MRLPYGHRSTELGSNFVLSDRKEGGITQRMKCQLPKMTLSLLIFVFGFTLAEATTKVAHRASDLEKTLDRYRHARSVTSGLVKVVNLSLLDQKQTSYGKLYFSKNRLRIEFTKPESLLLVMDGQNIWTERKLSKELGGQVQVVQIAVDDHRKNFQGPLPLLLGDKKALEDFTLKEKTPKKAKEPQRIFQLRPRDQKKYPDIVKIEVIIEGKKLRKLSYWDELDNKTSYEFRRTKFNKKVSKNQFLYSPPKNAKVTKFK